MDFPRPGKVGKKEYEVSLILFHFVISEKRSYKRESAVPKNLHEAPKHQWA